MDNLSEYFISLGHKLIKIGERIKNNEQDKVKKNVNKKLFTIVKKVSKFIDENFPELNKSEIKQVTGISSEALNLNIFSDFSRLNMEDMHTQLDDFIVEELLYIIKSHRLSGISSRDKKTLINYIIDNVRKRTKDVFINEDKK